MVVLGRIFEPSWEVDLLDQVDLSPGDRVLDVSSLVSRAGARETYERWCADGASLPFADGSFDVVVWRQGLRVLPAPGWTLSEMCRVLAPGGRAAVSMWGRIERMPVVAALTDVLEAHGCAGSAAVVRALFSLAEPADLRAFLADAGFERIRVRSVPRTVVLSSVAELVRRCVPDLPDDDEWSIVADLEIRCARWVDSEGLRIAMEANTAVASI